MKLNMLTSCYSFAVFLVGALSSCNLATEAELETLAADPKPQTQTSQPLASSTKTSTPAATPSVKTSSAPSTSSSFASKPAATAPAPVTNTASSLRSSGGVLTIPAALNARIVRAQVIHTRNGYHPAFAVSGASGAGVANGFQWINFGKNSSGVYNAGKPLSQFPKGKLGGAVWLVSGDRSPPFASDGNLVVTE